MALLGCIKAEQQNVFSLIRIPLVLSSHITNASIQRTGQPSQNILLKYVILVGNAMWTGKKMRNTFSKSEVQYNRKVFPEAEL